MSETAWVVLTGHYDDTEIVCVYSEDDHESAMKKCSENPDYRLEQWNIRENKNK